MAVSAIRFCSFFFVGLPVCVHGGRDQVAVGPTDVQGQSWGINGDQRAEAHNLIVPLVCSFSESSREPASAAARGHGSQRYSLKQHGWFEEGNGDNMTSSRIDQEAIGESCGPCSTNEFKPNNSSPAAPGMQLTDRLQMSDVHRMSQTAVSDFEVASEYLWQLDAINDSPKLQAPQVDHLLDSDSATMAAPPLDAGATSTDTGDLKNNVRVFLRILALIGMTACLVNFVFEHMRRMRAMVQSDEFVQRPQ